MAGERWARLLGEAWAALGGGETGAELQVTGVRGSLPSHLPVEDTAIACAGAALLAAADLQARRGGPALRTVRRRARRSPRPRWSRAAASATRRPDARRLARFPPSRCPPCFPPRGSGCST